MRRQIAIVVLVALIMLLFSGCFFMRVGDSGESVSESTDEMMLAALSAMESNDIEAFEQLFYTEALPADAAQREAQLQAMCDFYEGSLVKWQRTSINRNITTSAAGRTETVDCEYTVTTTKQTYRINLTRYIASGGDALSSFEMLLTPGV